MKNQLSTIIFLLIFSNTSTAQQLTASSFYKMYPVLHNPATVGSAESTIIGANFRTQWSSMPGAPKTGLIYGSSFIKSMNLGVGGYLFSDVTGPTSRTGIQMSYAYHILLKEKSSFSIGIEGRFQQFTFDRSKLETTLGASDPVLSGDNKKIKGDAGIGVAFTSSTLNIGASVSQLIQSKLNLYEGTGNQIAEARHYRHYYLHGFYNLNIDEQVKIVLNALLTYLPNAPTELQVGATVEHKELLWYGLTWKFNQAWMISAGLKIANKVSVGYSFDIYKTLLSVYEGGSNGHELLLQVELK